MNPREHVINIVYKQLINLVGRGSDIPFKAFDHLKGFS